MLTATEPRLIPAPHVLAWSAYIIHAPTPPQAAFLYLDTLEAFYGGAAGGGKSDALLMAALQYVDVPGYSALILRRTFADLALPGAIMDRAAAWLSGTAARWHEGSKTWAFPSGATLTFGYCERDADKYRYQGAELQFIGIDEVTQWEEPTYLYLFSRLRRREGVPVPLRMRSAGNPGGIGHDWVKARFVVGGRAAGRPFIPARLTDNPHLDQAAYRAALSVLDHVTRAQLEAGNWDVALTGDLFYPDRMPRLATPPAQVLGRVRYWDKAGTEGGGAYSCGLRMSRTRRGLYPAEYWIEDVVRGQWSSARRDAVIRTTAAGDGALVRIGVEQEPGSGGKQSADITISDLAGYSVYAERPTGDKVTRARPLAAQMEAGNVGLLTGAWNSALIAEYRAFPHGPYKDQVDAGAGAFNRLALAPAPTRQSNYLTAEDYADG